MGIFAFTWLLVGHLLVIWQLTQPINQDEIRGLFRALSNHGYGVALSFYVLCVMIELTVLLWPLQFLQDEDDFV